MPLLQLLPLFRVPLLQLLSLLLMTLFHLLVSVVIRLLSGGLLVFPVLLALEFLAFFILLGLQLVLLLLVFFIELCIAGVGSRRALAARDVVRMDYGLGSATGFSRSRLAAAFEFTGAGSGNDARSAVIG